MNYSELNNQDIFTNQGIEYIKFRNKKKEIDDKLLSINNSNNNSVYGIIEGFSDNKNPLDDEISKEMQELIENQKEYTKLLNEYNEIYKKANDRLIEYDKITKSDYTNKNIELEGVNGKESEVGYLTSDGKFKLYSSDEIYTNTINKNGCPKNKIKVNASRRNISDKGEVIIFNDGSQPNFTVGSPMEMEQSCGFEGHNVFVTRSGPLGKSKYEGCYNNSSSSELTKSEYQVPYNNKGVRRCQQFAHDTGNSVFAISRDGNNMNCYVGKDIDKVKNGGISTIPIQSWASPQVNGIFATLNVAGQLLIKGSGISQSNLTEGLKCKIYKGYMNDNPKFFNAPDAILLNTSEVNINDFTNISTSTNKLFPAINNNFTSVEWIGYVKANESGNWTFYLGSDDCSYMWIGSNAVSQYEVNNAFINNGGLHPNRVISRSVALTSGQYYPIRIQYGQNKGRYNFYLKIQRPNGNYTYNAKGLFFSTPTPFIDPLYPETGEFLETIWKSGEPVGDCHESIGGKINLEDSVSSWGYNCNAENTDVWGRNANYDVTYGNLTETVVNTLQKNTPYPRYGKVIVGKNIDNKRMDDVAWGCKKMFSSNYKCGNGPEKLIEIKGESFGKFARYDCRNEDGYCNFILVVQNNGNIVIKHKNKRFKSQPPIWTSNTQNKIDKIDESKMASKGKYGRPYLLPGETLNDGEFIGSETGSCFLMMTKGIGLQLFYNKLNCKKISNTSVAPKSNSPSSETLAVYSLPIANGLESIGTVSYIDSDGKKYDYPKNMIKKANDPKDTDNNVKYPYFYLGNFDNPGNDILTIEADNRKICEEKCNNMDNCDGYVFGNNKCYLKNSDMYPNSYRYRTPEFKLFKRPVYINNDNKSCRKFVNSIDSQRWESYISSEKEMDSSVKCMLNDYTNVINSQLNDIKNKLNNKASEINNKIVKLTEKEKAMLKNYGIDNDEIKNNILKINNIKTSGKEGFSTQSNSKTPGEKFIDTTRELTKLQNEYSNSKVKIANLRGMETTSQKELIHNNYKYMLWSILAVIVVIGGMKILKNKN